MHVWVDCFFYGFYMPIEQVQRYVSGMRLHQSVESIAPVSNKMKRSATTRQHLDQGYTTTNTSGDSDLVVEATEQTSGPRFGIASSILNFLLFVLDSSHQISSLHNEYRPPIVCTG